MGSSEASLSVQGTNPSRSSPKRGDTNTSLVDAEAFDEYVGGLSNLLETQGSDEAHDLEKTSTTVDNFEPRNQSIEAVIPHTDSDYFGCISSTLGDGAIDPLSAAKMPVTQHTCNLFQYCGSKTPYLSPNCCHLA